MTLARSRLGGSQSRIVGEFPPACCRNRSFSGSVTGPPSVPLQNAQRSENVALLAWKYRSLVGPMNDPSLYS